MVFAGLVFGMMASGLVGAAADAGVAFERKAVLGAGVEQTHAVETADLDGDGDLDAVTADYLQGRVLLLRNDGAAFVTVVLDGSLPGAYPVHVADIDLDGDVDVLAGGYQADTVAMYRNDGAGGFARTDLSTVADGVHSMATADLDRDGDVDLVVANQDGHSVWWMENDGAERFTAHEIDGAAWGAKSAEIVDVDADGDLDVVSANSATTEFAVLVNDGSQRFTKRVVDRTLTGAYDVCVGDLDADGDPDTAIASSLTDTIAWFRNDGRGGFVRRDVDTSAGGARSVGCVDVDLDGHVDLLAATPNDDTVAWYRNDGAGGFSWQAVDLAADGAYGIEAADLDGDGDVDVLAALRDSNEVVVYRRSGIAPPPASAFTTIEPARVLDTRRATAVGYRGPAPAAGGTIQVRVTGRAGVPAVGVTAIVANLTVTEATSTGYVQAFPTGRGEPGASSNLNVERPGQTVAAASVLPVGADGSITLVNQPGGHLVLDVTGYATVASSAVRAGRVVPVVPVRLLDTRPAQGGPGPLADESTVRVDVRGGLGLPPGARAVVGNLTATGNATPLYVQAAPSGGLRPGAWSSLNVDRAGQTRANQVIVPLGPDGAVELYASARTDLLFDVTGWVTGIDSDPSTVGRFVALRPARLLDTRPGSAVAHAGAKPGPASVLDVAVAGRAGVPADATALSLTVTATESSAAGYVQVASVGTLVPGSSSTVNVDGAGQTIANGATVGSDGGISVYVAKGAHVVVDVAGFFTG